MFKNSWPFIKKEGEWFVIGQEDGQNNQLFLSKKEIKLLKEKLNSIDIENFYWKNVR